MSRYSELARKAREEVRDLEEPFRSIAYETILQDLIEEAKKSGEARDREVAKDAQSTDPVELFLTNAVDAAQYAGLFGVKGKLREKSLAVLRLARSEFSVDGLTAPQIADILIKKFRVPRVHSKNVSRDLAKATAFVSRIRTDGEYRYLLTASGERHLESIVSKLK